jgi:hypothetical protein
MGNVVAKSTLVSVFGRTLTSSAVVLGMVGTVEAQCAFDAPAKAKSIKSSLVRAYASCPGATFAAPNTTTMAGVAGCAPPTASSIYEIDDAKGTCSIRAKHSVVTPCDNSDPAGCSVLGVSVKCAGIQDPGGGVLTSTVGWYLGLLFRATFNDPSNGDMTVIDYPLQATLPDATNGTLKERFELGNCPDPFFCPPPSGYLPPCTQLELLGVTLFDPDGNAFARLGSSGR